MRSNSILTLTTLAYVASAASVTVKVGSGGLVYSPNSITAAVGDTVVFEFDSPSHSVTEGSFSDACNPVTDGFNSGIINTDIGHCKAGMVGVINPPSSGDTFAAWKSAAAASDSDSAPPSEVFGGVISAPGGQPSTAPGVPAASKSSAAATSTSVEEPSSTEASPTTTGTDDEAPSTTGGSESTAAESTTAESTAAESTPAESTPATTVATTEASATESTLSTAISTESAGSGSGGGVYPSSNSSATLVPPPVETGNGAGILAPGGLIGTVALFLGAAVLFM
ncbi:hypothetical protein AA313_de0205497 [Arthrobotrys entomopaga]|nr:hypothetical protein AA313_de0205497 [Arthrobotrys entomopaga]